MSLKLLVGEYKVDEVFVLKESIDLFDKFVELVNTLDESPWYH